MSARLMNKISVTAQSARLCFSGNKISGPALPVFLEVGQPGRHLIFQNNILTSLKIEKIFELKKNN